VHKKYTYKNGKRYGPYLYENKRVGDKVVTTYLGVTDDSSNKKFISFKLFGIILAFLLVLLLLFFIYKNSFIVGMASLDVSSSYKAGEELSGSLKFNLKEGELIPKDSKIRVNFGEQIKEFSLSELVSQSVVSGDFFAENTGVTGSGEGYGLAGKKEFYPEVEFELRIFSDSEESSSGGAETPIETPSGEVVETIPENTEEATETPSGAEGESDIVEPVENIGEATETPSQAGESAATDSSETTSAEASESSEVVASSSGDVSSEISGESAITGAAISENEIIVPGKVKNGEMFSYNLEEQTAEIVSESVKANGSSISDSEIKLEIKDNVAEVSTNYKIIEEGFGQEYLGDKTLEIKIDLDKFEINVTESGKLNVELVYNNAVIVELEEEIVVSESSEEKEEIIDKEKEEIVDKEKEEGLIEINESIVNETIETNITLIENISSINLSLIKNIDDIRIARNGNTSINLSEYFAGAERYELNSSNISVIFEDDILTLIPELELVGFVKARIIAYSGNESLESNEFEIFVSSREIKIETQRERIIVGKPVKWTKNISVEGAENITIELEGAGNISVRKIEDGQEIEIKGITGRVSGEIELEKESKITRFFRNIFRGITGRTIEEFNSSALVEVSLNDSATNYIIEYYTEAPQAYEENISNGKRVIVSGPDNLNYTDVLAFSEIDESFGIKDKSKIKIYWSENNSYVQFNASDLDENGVIDYIEWNVPHLSNQTFEIILIIKAEHLDSNRTFIEDVYELVKARDGNWTSIPAGDYVRVTFEQPLTSEKDITIYARACADNSTILINGVNVPCDIYKKKLRLDEIRGSL